jgi:hypothetical protein
MAAADPDRGGRLLLSVGVTATDGADPEDVERLGRQLRSELRQLDVDDVTAVADGDAPPGAKGAAASLGELLVTMSAGGGVFVTVLATIRDWLGRRSDAQAVKLTLDGDTLELTRATAAERADLVEAFLARHQRS